jgi:hypothetical protein
VSLSRTLGPLSMSLDTWPSVNVPRHLALFQCPSTLSPLSMSLDTWPPANVPRHVTYCQCPSSKCSSTLDLLPMSLDTWPTANVPMHILIFPRHVAYYQCPLTLGPLPMSLDTWFSLSFIGPGYWLRPRSLTSWFYQLTLTISELRWLANRRNLYSGLIQPPIDQ